MSFAMARSDTMDTLASTLSKQSSVGYLTPSPSYQGFIDEEDMQDDDYHKRDSAYKKADDIFKEINDPEEVAPCPTPPTMALQRFPQGASIVELRNRKQRTAVHKPLLQKLDSQETPSKAVKQDNKKANVSSKRLSQGSKNVHVDFSEQSSDEPYSPDEVATGTLVSKMRNLQIKAPKQTADIRAFTAEVAKLKADLEEQKERYTTLEQQHIQDKADADAQKVTYHQNLDYKDEELAKAKAEYEGKLSALCMERDAARSEAQHTLTTLEADISRLRAIHQQELEDMRLRTEQEATRERVRVVSKKETELQACKAQIKRDHLENTTLGAKLESAILAKESAEIDLETQAQDHSTQLSALQARLDGSKEKIDALSKEINTANTERAALGQRVDAASSTIRTQQLSLDTSEERVRTVEHELDSLRGTLTSLTEERDLALSRHKTAEEEGANLESQYEATMLQVNALQVNLDAAEEGRNDLSKRIDGILSKAKEDVEAARKQIADLQRRNEGMQAIARRTRELQEEALAFSSACPVA